MKENLGRPLQWLVCLLHCNELPFRKFFSVVDRGQTTGPKSSTGEIASALNFDPKDKPIAAFLPVPGKVIDISEDVKKDLSTDQLYFLRACLAVEAGYQASQDIPFLQLAQPGNLSHARWLTTGNRLLRLYMSTDSPPETLKRITSFIVNFYGPAWFQIKLHCSCQDGPRNLFYMIQLCQDLDASDQEIICPVLNNNNYFTHSENILLTAVGDINEDNRKYRIENFIAAREQLDPHDCNIRTFEKKNIALNFSAASYLDIIDWTKCDVTPPPLL